MKTAPNTTAQIAADIKQMIAKNEVSIARAIALSKTTADSDQYACVWPEVMTTVGIDMQTKNVGQKYFVSNAFEPQTWEKREAEVICMVLRNEHKQTPEAMRIAQYYQKLSEFYKECNGILNNQLQHFTK